MTLPLTMGVVPGPLATRILVHDGSLPLLKARLLPHGPQEPRAVLALAEALTLWTGQPCHVAIAAGGRGAFCATPRWLDTFELVTRPPAVTVTCVRHDAVPADPAPGAGFGDFADVRRLLHRGPWR
jgi:hypothetical protein